MSVQIKTFVLQDEAGEQTVNSFLQNKRIEQLSATFADGKWNVLIAFDQARNDRPADRRMDSRQESRGDRPQNRERDTRRGDRAPIAAERPARAERPDPARPIDVTPEDMPMYDAIRRWRNARAKEAGIKPFHLFSNQILEEIVKTKPKTSAELRPLLKDMDDAAFDKYKNELEGFLSGANGQESSLAQASTEATTA